MCIRDSSAVETPEEEEDEGGEADEASERWTLLARVQGLVAAERPNEQAQWVSATVVDTSGSGPQCSLVYDDGRFEAAVPAHISLYLSISPLSPYISLNLRFEAAVPAHRAQLEPQPQPLP